MCCGRSWTRYSRCKYTQHLPAKGPQGDRSFGQAFSKACRSRAEPWSLPAGSERLRGGYSGGGAYGKGYEPCLIGALWGNSGAALQGNGLCGGRPLRRLRATPPLSGEARPKSRLRRLAVGGCWRSPLEGRLAGFGWCLPEERALRGNPSVACGRHLPFQGRHGLRAAFGGWP